MRVLKRILYTAFILAAMCGAVYLFPKNRTVAFIAFVTVLWHALALWSASYISSYRFENPNAKYIEIKNKTLKRLLVRPFSAGGFSSTIERDNRINIVGLVLHAVNALLFVGFEIFLLLPPIPCETYIYTAVLSAGRYSRHKTFIEIPLNSLNEVIVGEASQYFALAVCIIFLAFYGIFERKVNKMTGRKEKPVKKLENIEWYFPLYDSLAELAIRQNPKKHKFWYDKGQLEQIGDAVRAASENAELRLDYRGDRLVSFTVVDTLNNLVRFTGHFV